MKYASYEVMARKRRRQLKTCVTHVSDDLDQSAVAITIADPLALIALARTDPVTAAREGQAAATTLETGFNDYHIGLIGTAYASAYHMVRTDGAWIQFLRDPGWGGLTGKPKDTLRSQNRMLHHVMRYMFRAEGQVARARVRVYANMLIDRFHKGFSPEKVVPLINRWGIENLRKVGEAQRRAEREGTNTYFDDLNDEGSDEIESSSTPAKIEVQDLTPAQTERCVGVLATFNAEFMALLQSSRKKVG